MLVIHGGAGTMLRERSTPEQRRRYKAALADALQAGYKVLEHGGEAMDAAVAAVTSMESEFICQCQLVVDVDHSSRLSAIQLGERSCLQRVRKGGIQCEYPNRD